MAHDPERWFESADAPLPLRDWLRGARADLPDRRRLKMMGLTPAAVAAACVSASDAANAGVVGTANAAASPGTTAGLSATGTGGAATSTASVFTATGVQLVTGVGVAVVAGAIGLGAWMTTEGEGEREPHAPVVVALSEAPAPLPDPASERELSEHEVPPPEQGIEAPSSSEPPPSSRGSRTHERVPEAVLLRRAQQFVATDPSQAMRLLQQHQREYPRGSLIQEREVLRIEALQRLGRAEEGRALRERFERRYPDSAHRPKIEGAGPGR